MLQKKSAKKRINTWICDPSAWIASKTWRNHRNKEKTVKCWCDSFWSDALSSYLTFPAWKSGGHRFSSPVWSHTPVCRCDRASSDRSGRHGTRPGHRGTGSRRRQTPLHGLHQPDWHQDSPPWCKEEEKERKSQLVILMWNQDLIILHLILFSLYCYNCYCVLPCGQEENPGGSVGWVVELVYESFSLWGCCASIQS